MTYEVKNVNDNVISIDITLCDDELQMYNYLTHKLRTDKVDNEFVDVMSDFGFSWSNNFLGFTDSNYLREFYEYTKECFGERY